ncbi:hypothetical protein RZ517_06810 [Roseovarius sp. S88]|uniref:Uncharacterized protein n=1 Tax=Roseovarius phycicola TaxID=3080976 RepID=A0ABZ2HIL0_9RHOB
MALGTTIDIRSVKTLASDALIVPMGARRKHEAWSELSERYDDSGFSGGSMERPGLRREGLTLTRRYWYYTSRKSGSEDRNGVDRLPAKEIERLVFSSLENCLHDKTWLANQARRTEGGDASISDILQAQRRGSQSLPKTTAIPNPRVFSV